MESHDPLIIWKQKNFERDTAEKEFKKDWLIQRRWRDDIVWNNENKFYYIAYVNVTVDKGMKTEGNITKRFSAENVQSEIYKMNIRDVRIMTRSLGLKPRD